MNRRRVLRWLASSGAVSLFGCALLRPGEQSSVRPTPERPERLGDEALVDYVGDHAETTVANRMIRDREVSTVSVGCRAVVAKRNGAGIYLVAECFGSSQFEDMTGSFTTTPFYAVTDSDTVAVDNEQVRDTEVYESSEESENLDQTSGIEVFNFDDTEHDLTVSVSDTERARSDPVSERTFALSRHAGIDIFELVRKAGTYDVTATLNDGTGRPFQWEVVEDSAWTGLWIAITPDGQLLACGAVDSECATRYPLPPERDTLTPRNPV